MGKAAGPRSPRRCRRHRRRRQESVAPSRRDDCAKEMRDASRTDILQCACVRNSNLSSASGIAGSHSLAPVHCDSCAITEHLSSVRSLQLGESRWVERYIMCTWPLLTLHMHARACQSRYPRTCMPLPRHDTPTTRRGRAGQTRRQRDDRRATSHTQTTSAMCACVRSRVCNQHVGSWDRRISLPRSSTLP